MYGVYCTPVLLLLGLDRQNMSHLCQSGSVYTIYSILITAVFVKNDMYVIVRAARARGEQLSFNNLNIGLEIL